MLGPQLEPVGPTTVRWEGNDYLFFGGNDYHRLAFHPEVIEASIKASQKWGLNASGSRTTSANHPIYCELESRLAEFLEAEDAVVFSAGYLSNTILLQAVHDQYSHFLIDEIAHTSLVEAALVTQKPMIRFDHRSAKSLSERLSELPQGSTPLVLTDGVFASSGAIAFLAEYASLGAMIAVDDAHGMATLGPKGQGTWSKCKIKRSKAYQTGTLSKGLGGFGGVIAGDRETIERIRAKSSAFTGSTPVPYPLAAATLKSLEILTREPERISLLQQRSIAVKTQLKHAGFNTSSGASPICSVTFLDEAKNRVLFEDLKKDRIYPNFIDYPGSPPGGHFRFTLSSAHSDDEIKRLIHCIGGCVSRLGPVQHHH